MEHLKYLEQQFLNEQTADVIFHINTGKGTAKIPAHKVLLAASSKVFEKRFNETTNLKQIEINNVTPDAFREFLYAFYAKHPEKNYTIPNMVSVLQLARAFAVDHCTSTCEKFLVVRLADNELIFGYGVATEFQLSDLKKHCLIQINTKKAAVLTSQVFFQCDTRIFYDLVCNLTIQHSNEIILVWNACLYWIEVEIGKNPINMEKHLEFLIKQFGDDFQTYAKKHYGHLFTTGHHTLPNLQPIQPQYEIKNELMVVRLLQTMLATQICSANDAIEIELKCTKKIALTGIAFATVSGSPRGKFSINICRDEGESLLIEQNLTSKSKTFDEPKNFIAIEGGGGGIILESNKSYIVRVDLHKDVVYYRSYAVKNHFVQHDLGITFTTYKRDIFSHFLFSEISVR